MHNTYVPSTCDKVPTYFIYVLFIFFISQRSCNYHVISIYMLFLIWHVCNTMTSHVCVGRTSCVTLVCAQIISFWHFKFLFANNHGFFQKTNCDIVTLLIIHKRSQPNLAIGEKESRFVFNKLVIFWQLATTYCLNMAI